MRLLDPTAGTVKIHGEDVTGVRGAGKRELWRGLQMVYQNPDSALDPRHTVAQIISEPLSNYKFGSKVRAEGPACRELLDSVNLPARMAGLGTKELSGGQRQRVAIARALALGAKTSGPGRGALGTGCADTGADPDTARATCKPTTGCPTSSSPTTCTWLNASPTTWVSCAEANWSRWGPPPMSSATPKANTRNFSWTRTRDASSGNWPTPKPSSTRLEI